VEKELSYFDVEILGVALPHSVYRQRIQRREHTMTKYLTIVLFTLALSTSALAQVKLQGQFTATQDCPALLSIKKGTNPGEVTLTAGTSYRLLGKNKDAASYYWIEVPIANPTQRWVAVACGTTDSKDVSAPAAGRAAGRAAVNTPQGTVKPKPQPKAPKDGVAFYVLALSWEPAFCEKMKGKTECKSETAASYEASHFSLHGLWPQPRRNVFCGVDQATAALDDQHQWDRLPAPQMSAETKAGLDKVMPGTQSVLERHEWIKHGTCYPGGNADTYFKDAVRLVNDVNASAVQRFVAANIGKSIQTSDLRAKFDEAYGEGTGDRVRVSCSPDGMISELTIGLKGDISSGAKLSDLIAASAPTDAGCSAGVIDAVN
jgi:ribonuclease T2